MSLAHQSRGRELTGTERALAEALMSIFAGGEHDFAAVTCELNERGVARPSGALGPWDASVLADELHRINVALDEPRGRDGVGA